MAFLDKLKDVAEKAKETAVNAKAAYEQKKAEAEQHKNEMVERANAKSQEIIHAIKAYNNNGSFFENIGKDELLRFTKDFYDKIMLPAKSVSASKLFMYPYISEKQIEKFKEGFTDFDSGETPLVYLKLESKQEIMITYNTLYFSLALEEDPSFFTKGAISCDEVDIFAIEKTDTDYLFKCDEYVLASFTAEKSITEDFLALDNYFKCILTHDFDISDEKADKLIREKIGEKVYSEVKKYMVFDDELIVYFAWGVNSLSAKDYVVCTTKQIIIVDREMLGATANIKQFYYEDITSASTVQNTKSGDLVVDLLATAIVAATQTCDLVLSVAGAVTRIDTLYKIEAERVVAVYHQYRKAAKMQSSTPQQVVIQQTTPQADPMEQLMSLTKLKDAGIISEEEFTQKKAELLARI